MKYQSQVEQLYSTSLYSCDVQQAPLVLGSERGSPLALLFSSPL